MAGGIQKGSLTNLLVEYIISIFSASIQTFEPQFFYSELSSVRSVQICTFSGDVAILGCDLSVKLANIAPIWLIWLHPLVVITNKLWYQNSNPKMKIRPNLPVVSESTR